MLFPAYAGVIPLDEIYHAIFDTFPRIRGGDPIRMAFCVGFCVFSPHTRG